MEVSLGSESAKHENEKLSVQMDLVSELNEFLRYMDSISDEVYENLDAKEI